MADTPKNKSDATRAAIPNVASSSKSVLEQSNEDAQKKQTAEENEKKNRETQKDIIDRIVKKYNEERKAMEIAKVAALNRERIKGYKPFKLIGGVTNEARDSAPSMQITNEQYRDPLKYGLYQSTIDKDHQYRFAYDEKGIRCLDNPQSLEGFKIMMSEMMNFAAGEVGENHLKLNWNKEEVTEDKLNIILDLAKEKGLTLDFGSGVQEYLASYLKDKTLIDKVLGKLTGKDAMRTWVEGFQGSTTYAAHQSTISEKAQRERQIKLLTKLADVNKDVQDARRKFEMSQEQQLQKAQFDYGYTAKSLATASKDQNSKKNYSPQGDGLENFRKELAADDNKEAQQKVVNQYLEDVELRAKRIDAAYNLLIREQSLGEQSKKSTDVPSIKENMLLIESTQAEREKLITEIEKERTQLEAITQEMHGDANANKLQGLPDQKSIEDRLESVRNTLNKVADNDLTNIKNDLEQMPKALETRVTEVEAQAQTPQNK